MNSQRKVCEIKMKMMMMSVLG